MNDILHFMVKNLSGKATPALFFILLAVSMVLWGGSWVTAKVIASSAASEVLVFWRFLFTFICFIPLIFISGESLAVTPGTLKKLFLASLFLVAYNKFFFTGLRTGFAGAGGVLVTSLNPVLTFAFSVFLYRTVLRKRDIAGLVLGFAGGLVLLSIWDVSMQKLVNGGNIFFLLAAFLWAFMTLISQETQKKISFLVYSFYVYGFTSIISLPIALPYGILSVFSEGPVFWLNLLYLSVFATAFATTVYFLAAGRLGGHRASSFIFIVPTSAVFFSWLFLGEVPQVTTIIGGILTVCAVYIINLRKNKTAIPGNASDTSI